MKRFFLAFFFSMAMLYLPAQDTKTYQFEKGIGGLEFTKIEIIGAVPNGEGTRVFLELSRIGAIQKKAGPVWSGGNDPITVKALGIIDLAANQGVEQEIVRWLKPDGVYAKQYNILEAPGSILGDPIATQDDCVELLDLVKEYPELRQLYGDVSKEIEPYSYYKNFVNYKALAGKPKSLVLNLYNVDSEGRRSNEDKEIDIEGYRGSTKKDYWARIEETKCDKVSGNFWAYHGRLIQGEYRNRANMFLQELVVFDKEGEVLNRTDMEFEKPQVLKGSQYFYYLEDDFTRISGKAHVYGEAFGFGYKKLNPDPNETLKQYYEWDADGKLVQQVAFDAPNAGFDPLYMVKGEEKSTIFADSEGDLYFMYFANGELAGSEKLDANHPVAASIKDWKSSLKSGDLGLIQSRPIGDNQIQIYALTKMVSPGAGQPSVRQYVGDVFFLTDKAGNLLNVNALMGAVGEEGNRYSFFPAGENLVMVVKNGESNLKVLKATPSGKFDALFVSQPGNSSTAASYLEENNRLVITQLTPKKVVEIQLIDLD